MSRNPRQTCPLTATANAAHLSSPSFGIPHSTAEVDTDHDCLRKSQFPGQIFGRKIRGKVTSSDNTARETVMATAEWSQTGWIWILALPPTHCVTLGKSLPLSVTHCLHLLRSQLQSPRTLLTLILHDSICSSFPK